VFSPEVVFFNFRKIGKILNLCVTLKLLYYVMFNPASQKNIVLHAHVNAVKQIILFCTSCLVNLSQISDIKFNHNYILAVMVHF